MSGRNGGQFRSEFDLKSGIWTIPANRMKAAEEHRVPLSSRALDIINHLAEHKMSDYVFTGRANKPMSNIRHLQKQSEAYADEVALRIKHEHRPSTTGLTLEFHELSDKPILFGNLAITPFQVDHAPVIPAYGLVFEAYRKKLVFSGDTRPCSSLSHVLRQADILVQEVFIDREMQEIPGKRSAQTIQSVRSYHTTPHEAAGLAAEGKVDVLMLTHIVPPSANRTALVHEVAAHFSGPILIAEDLMRYDILNKIVVSGLTTLRL